MIHADTLLDYMTNVATNALKKGYQAGDICPQMILTACQLAHQYGASKKLVIETVESAFELLDMLDKE